MPCDLMEPNEFLCRMLSRFSTLDAWRPLVTGPVDMTVAYLLCLTNEIPKRPDRLVITFSHFLCESNMAFVRVTVVGMIKTIHQIDVEILNISLRWQ
jgi:hypothetical protein